MKNLELFKNAKNASFLLKNISDAERSHAIVSVSNALLVRQNEILVANSADLARQKEIGAKESFLDRLMLNSARIKAICEDMVKVSELSTPIGSVLNEWTAPSGILIKKVSVPYGVIGVIYEARPNVTVDVFSLCLKTANVCLLKGGSDANETNTKIVEIIRDALASTSIPTDSIVLLPSDRSSAEELITARGFVDLLVPRGGKGLISYVLQNATVPVIETGAGVCHTYVSKNANLEEAFSILQNAKMSRPSVCNACETLLVDKEIASQFIKMVADRIPSLSLHGGAEENAILPMQPLSENGYYTEFDSCDLSIKIVNGVYDAVSHVNTFGTHHSDCICTCDNAEAEYFMANTDSACVYHNASTRFSDGGCFGFGAELGISTQKCHPRGPMGLNEMTTYQYLIYGKGQVR